MGPLASSIGGFLFHAVTLTTLCNRHCARASRSRIATTESVSLRADEELTAFFELEAPIRTCGRLPP
jgi:hypothetical protein